VENFLPEMLRRNKYHASPLPYFFFLSYTLTAVVIVIEVYG